MLSADLEATFGDGGFSIEASLETVTGDLGGVSVDASGIDLDGLANVATSVEEVSVGDIASVTGDVVGQITELLTELPAIDGVLQPLEALVELVGVVSSGGLADAIGVLDGAGGEDGLRGLGALDARLGTVKAVRDEPSVAAIFDLVTGVVGDGVDFDGAIADATGWFDGLRQLVNLVGGLMAVESSSRDLTRLTGIAAAMLAPGDLAAARAEVVRFRNANLGDLLVGIDPDDVQLVSLVGDPLMAYAAANRTLADRLARGMAFGEATLAAGGVTDVAERLDAGAAMLTEDALEPVRALADVVAGWLRPLLELDLPDPFADVDSFAIEVVAMIERLGEAVDALDPAIVATPIRAALADSIGVFDEIASAAEEVRALLSSSLGAAREVISAIDLGPVAEIVAQIIAPISDALDTLTGLVGDAQAGIESTSAQAIAGLETARTSVQGAADAVAEAFERIDALLTTLGLDDLQASIEALVTPAAEALAKARLDPYFDAANDVIDGAASAIELVPLSILPDDALAELADAVEPIQAIDFQADVADVLKARLAEISDALDTEVLGQIDAAYAEVLAFLESIDPNEALLAVEFEAFDPMIAALRSVDLDALLAPVEEALTPIRAAIAEFDPVGEVLDPIEALLDDLAANVEAFDPAALLEPLEAEVEALTATITDTVFFDRWGDWLDEAERLVNDGLNRVDLGALFDALDTVFDSFVDEIADGGRPDGPSVFGTVVGALLHGSNLGVRVDSFGSVMGWVNGADGAAHVINQLNETVASVDQMIAAVEQVQIDALVAELQPMHRAIVEALEAHPEESALRVRLEAEIRIASPQELFEPYAAHHASYLAALRDLAVVLRRLASSGRSEITAIASGLHQAAMPLQPLAVQLRALLGSVGLDPDGASIREVVAELLRTFRPSTLLSPLLPVVESLGTKIASVAIDGVLGPVREVVVTIGDVLDAIDISFIREELAATHGEIVELIDALSPTALLRPVVDEVEALQTTLVDFDPLGPVREVVDAMTAAIDDVDATVRPTVLFAPVTDLYERIVAALGVLDLSAILEPVLVALDEIELQLGEGLDETAVALTRLQDALPNDSDLGGSGGGSVSGGIGVGAG
ncbi:MAG: hypothetical protein AAGA37_13670 [Actinomycetota bacterium]